MQRKEGIRESLKAMQEGKRFKFRAVFSRLGVDRRFPNLEKALLLNVCVLNEGEKNHLEEVTDHVWVSKSKRWTNVSKTLKEGDTIEFTAEIKKYNKEGKNSYFIDYGLTSIRSVEIVK